MKLLAIAIAVILCGCATVTAVRSPSGVVVQAGMTTDEVMSAWGNPQNLVDLTDRRRTLYPTSHIYEYPHATVYFINGIVDHLAPRYGCSGRDIPAKCY